ncbi:MAG: hypothetical protein J6I85_00485, partial [Clostridia bacterium]|nr:hypothetical protein [Clostridia bacterium]
MQEKRAQEKLNKKADETFRKIIMGRYLVTFEEGIEQICNKGSDDLKNYYISKVDNTLGLNEESESDDEDNPEYINALINIIKESTGSNSENSDTTEDAKTYLMHLFGVIFFLAVAILAIPGWIVCCSCCCCNCCCCCCKKPVCKLPFIIIAIVFYALVVAVCLYGLIKSNSIFTGLSDTECSVLQLFNETIEGEAKSDKPKWVGINGITNIFDEINAKIQNTGKETLSDLRTQKNTIENEKNEFENSLKDKSFAITNDNNNLQTIGSHEYRLDITTTDIYGIYANQPSSHTGFVKAWYTEYSLIAEQSKKYIDDASENFDKIIRDPQVTSSLNDVKDSVKSIGDSINDVKNSIADVIVDYSDTIDKYGKLGFNVVFGVLAGIDIIIAALMILLAFCSGEKCKYCCCFRCGFKIIIHILWNILALLMIITFFIGFIFTFVGAIGKDLVLVVNYFISESNLNQTEPVLFGSEGKKLSVCFNGDGDILKELSDEGEINLNDTNSFGNLRDLTGDLDSVQTDFRNLKQQTVTYNSMIEAIKERADYKINFKVIQKDSSSQYYELSSLLNELNNKNEVKSQNHKWSLTCTSGDTNCKTLKDDEINIYTQTETTNTVDIIKIIMKLVENQNNKAGTSATNNYRKLTDELKGKYDTFLESEIDAIEIFKTKINDLISIFEEYIGENGGLFDFVNCKFIGSHIKIILKNLKNGLGGNFYNIGICFLLSGCSLAVAI